ncbi:MAG: ASKHA domain-containing protein [Thermodesulfobacteriota bacterium]
MTTPMTTWVEHVSLVPPSLSDNTADADRLLAALRKTFGIGTIPIDMSLLRLLPDRLRQWGYRARCLVFSDGSTAHLAGLTAADDHRPMAGLAVDLGTTMIAIRLIDLGTGRAMAESSFENPQTARGDDILTRIHFAEGTDDGLTRLHRLTLEGLNAAVSGLCRANGLSAEDVYLVALAGNTTMTHFFLNLPARWLIREPYIPVVNEPGIIRAADLGMAVNPLARVYVFPNIGSYFGGDLVSGILYSGLARGDRTCLLVDVGTNAEVVFGNRDWLIACAGAAGPALEGGVTSIGAKAGPGVIHRLALDPETHLITTETINGLPPKGICGSALIDLVAGLFTAGILDIRGKLTGDRHGRIVDNDGIREFVVVPAEASATGRPLALSQPDIDNLIRSKAAMYTILRTLTTTVGLSFDDIDTFYVAGTFGSLINPRSAITIGMLPDLPMEKFTVLGNSSLEGAAMVLSSRGPIREIPEIKKRLTYLELNVNQDFMNRFSAAKFLPHTDVSRFPSVTVPRQ